MVKEHDVQKDFSVIELQIIYNLIIFSYKV